MKINKVLDLYYKSYNKAAIGKEVGRSTINNFKAVIGAQKRPEFYQRLKKVIFNWACGRFYWPNTFPNAIDDASASLLYSIVRLIRPEIAIEIGTAEGNSCLAIGQALEDNKRGILYTMDPLDRELVKIAIKKSKLNRRINYIVDYSTNILPKLNLPKIDFAFIDGDHSYEGVLKDFELITDLIPKGGVIAYHDTILFDGPKKVVKHMADSGKYEVVTLPTLSGEKSEGVGGFTPINKDVKPAGITICKRI